MTDEELFRQLVPQSTQERDEFLAEGDFDLQQCKRVLALLAAHDQPDSLLKTADMPSTIEGSSRVVPGVTIGPCKLREQIGQGAWSQISRWALCDSSNLESYPTIMSRLIQILSAIESGDQQAAEQSLPLVYDELRKLAKARPPNVLSTCYSEYWQTCDR